MCGLLTPDAGSGTCLGYDIRTESVAIKRNVGYMTQRFSFWDDLTIGENLDFVARVYEMKDRKAAVDTRARRPRPRDACRAAHRHAVGRLEAAARARCVHAAPAAAAAARRAHRGCRSQRAPRILGGAASARGAGNLDPRQHALHGRGVALSQARVHRVRAPAGAGDRRRSDREPGAHDVRVPPGAISRRSRSRCKASPASSRPLRSAT